MENKIPQLESSSKISYKNREREAKVIPLTQLVTFLVCCNYDNTNGGINNNHTLRNILYKDINGIYPNSNEYDTAKCSQLILASSQIMRFTVPFVKKSTALRRVESTVA